MWASSISTTFSARVSYKNNTVMADNREELDIIMADYLENVNITITIKTAK